jgi:predicted phosphodiesterase
MKNNMNRTKIVGLTDIQGLHYDKKAWYVAMKFVKDYKPDFTVINGDFMDMQMLSKYDASNPGAWEELNKEYILCNLLLDEVQKYSKEVVYVMGNHEDRAWKYVSKYPYLKGMIEPDVKLRLKERGIKWVPYNGEPIEFGPIKFIHGEYHGKNHAKKTADRYGGVTFYGHTHTIEAMSVERYNEAAFAMSMGCLCKYDLPYILKRPSAWQQGFGVFEVYGERPHPHLYQDSNYNFTVVRINEDYSFVAPNGKLYQYD